MPNFVYLNSKFMSHNQEILLECKYDDILGEDLLDQSVDSEKEPMEQEVVVLNEVEPADPGHMLACSDRGIFAEVDLIKLQTLDGCQCPNLGGSWSSCPIECWASKSEQDSAMDPDMEGQDMGLEDPSLSLQSAVPPLGQESSRQEFKQWSHQSEHSDQRVQEYVQEAQHRNSH